MIREITKEKFEELFRKKFFEAMADVVDQWLIENGVTLAGEE